MAVELVEVDYVRRHVVTAAGARLPITGLFDGRGRPAATSAEAVVGFAGERGGQLRFRIGPFERRSLQ